MSFSRRGLDALAVAAQAGTIDAVLTKDLSCLGRHKTQTALFIDYLREHQVRVISVTEGIDTFREEDDLILGVRGLMNDYYAKDISKKIRAGYRQKQQARPAAGNRAKHRYAGLLTCRDCGDGFVPMIRYWNGSKRIEYVCRRYHRNGKSHCSSHRIHEEVLDKAVWNYAEELRKRYAAELKKIAQLQKQWALRKPSLDAHCLALQKKILKLEQEIDELVMEKLKK